jgi:hypothetical protein
MAARKKPIAEVAPAYADDTTYAVKLMWPVMFRRSKYLPLPVHEMSGAFLKQIIEQEGADVVDSAEPR